MRHDKRQQRREDVAARIENSDPMYRHCRIFGCGQPTTAAASTGLNHLYCRRHEDHYERHGSYTKRSYRAAELKPHREAARDWFLAHQGAPEVVLAVKAVEGLYQSAGGRVDAFRLRGRSPADRARAVWALLRETGVSPVEPVLAWLAIERMVQADPQRENREEFKRVQAAKLLHRMAGGTHKRWERVRPGGKTATEELHVYPHSRGRVLRHIGDQLEAVVGIAGRAMLACG